MNKNLLIGAIVILSVGIGFFVLTKQNSQTSVPVTKSEPQLSPSVITEQKITLIGTVKLLNNNSDPAQYSYELTLNFPFYDKLESTGNSYVSKMPILSRDKVLQEDIKRYVGEQVAVEGLMAWGLAESRYLEVSAITDMSSWTLYTNKTYGYSLMFPTTYEVPPQSEKQKSQLGVDNNTVVEKKSDPSGSSVIVIDVNQDKDTLSLGDYMDKNMKMFGINGPLLGGIFNGYDCVFNKNQPGTNVFLKQGQYVYHITAPTSSTDKEVRDIVATFKFTDDSKILNYDKAIKILQAIPEIQIIENAVIKNGRKTFFTQGSISGDVVTVWLYEGGFPDQHTTRIDTFNVNIKSKVITVDDVAMKSGQETITLDEWKKTVKTRFQ